jgi:hypothetical protein
MAWIDLRSDVEEVFGDVRIERHERGFFVDRGFRDPHQDADRWLLLSAEEREREAPAFAVKLARVRAMNARALVKRRRDRAAYMRALRARNPELRAREAARSRARRDDPEKSAARARAWRERKKGAPLRAYRRKV